MTLLAHSPSTRFNEPIDLTATEPPEQRGLTRDGVRLLVAGRDGVAHTTFRQLTEHIGAGDLVVVNNSATIAAELDAALDGRPVALHLATPLDDGDWVIELRTAPDAAQPILDARPGQQITAGAVTMRLVAPYPQDGGSPIGSGNRLWRAALAGSRRALDRRIVRHGRPIAYGYLAGRWPLAAYQTVFATERGSAEMPSAGRPFTDVLVAALLAKGATIAPITLHTGVSSQEANEPPQPERYAVSAETARLVNAARLAGRRVIAVGTTVTRALESAVGADGLVRESRGWTTLVIDPDHPVRAVNGLITGLHNPEASHLLLVEAVAGPELTQRAYDEAFAAGYLWHEFGDSCLLLP